MTYDVIVVGGSYAGISAGLQVARARRTILVLDADRRRNRFAHNSYGFIGQDGHDPEQIVTYARKELLAYPTVEWIHTFATGAHRTDEGFRVTTEKGKSYVARRLILATGVIDHLPDIPGLAERWGRSIYHCPYCHGFEIEKGLIGVLAVSSASMHQALLLPDWGSTIFFLNGDLQPDGAQLSQLARRNVKIEKQKIVRISGEVADIELSDGRVISLDGFFTLSSTSLASTLAEQLGCNFKEGAVGPYVDTDDSKETSIPGVFACGDTARASGSVALAVGEGALAGIAAHQSLIFRDG